MDTAAGDAVRERLLAEIRNLGFRPEVRERFVCRATPRGPLIDCGFARNIVFSIGPREGPAVLAAAHYDSVPAGPGAGDDGTGLAVWLEVARLMAHEQLERRVVFLFTDGEEPGLLGAFAFANDDPTMGSIESLVNVDCRGNRGPAIFFETNQPNADAIAAFAPAPRGVANSVAADVYRLLPNSSDVSALTRPGLDIVNIALLDGFEDYHTPQDTLSSQDPRSIQHAGDIALEVTRRFARAADRGQNVDMVYTDIASRAFVAMPSWAGQALLGMFALIAVAAFWRAGGEARWRTLAAPVAGLVIAAVFASDAGLALGLLRPGEDYGWAYPEPTRAWCVLVGLLGPVLSFMMLRVNRASAGQAAMIWFALLGLAASFGLSGISILFALPAAAYALGSLAAFFWKSAQILGAIVAAVLAVLIWGPTLYLSELALGFAYPFALALVAAIMALTWAPIFMRAQGDAPWRAAVLVLGVGALGCAIASAVVPSASAARPSPLNINYFVEEGGEARVLAGPAERALPRELGPGFMPQTILPGDLYETWAMSTEAVAVLSPALEEISVANEGGERIFRARLRTNGASRSVIRMPRTARPLRATVNGASATFADTGGESDYLNLACDGRACDGAQVSIALEPGGELGDWRLIGQFPGASVPEAVRAVRARRPATTTQIQNGDSVVTLQLLEF
jgi:hypothetical protein